MTVETCLKRAEVAKTPEETKFWEERAARKIAKHSKYAHLRKEEQPKSKGKK